MRFLSDEHFAAANAAFLMDAELQRSLPGVTLAIVYSVSDAPDGDFVYHIRIADGAVRMRSGDLAEYDAEVRSSYDTAARISRAELGNQTAVMMGKVRIKGAMVKLIRHQGVLNRVQALSAGIGVGY
ncbi:MAG: SCP2 sterol-binding domain-containing protein [Gemmatimonadaceae bacterium]